MKLENLATTLKFNKYYCSRWASFSSCLFASSIAATAYAFGVFSEDLAKALNYDQKSVDLMASIGETGGYMGLFCGIIMRYVGPRFTLMIGLSFVFSGFQYIYKAGTLAINSSLWSVAGMFFVSQLGSSCIDVTAITVSIRNFPQQDRGKAAGLVKAYVGLSSAVLSQLYHDFYDGEAVQFLKFLSYFVPLVLLIAALQINFVGGSDVSYDIEQRAGVRTDFVPWFLHLIILLFYILLTAVVGEMYEFHQNTTFVFGCFTLGLLLSILIVPRLYGKLLLESPSKIVSEHEETVHLLEHCSNNKKSHEPVEEGLVEKEHWEKTMQGDGSYTDISLEKAIRLQSFWVLFGMMFCSAGSGLIVINNLPQIAESLGRNGTSFLVSLFGISNCVGRATIGWLSDRIMDKCPRPVLLCVVVFLMGANCLLFSLSFPILLSPCIVLTGYFYGGTFSLIAALAGDFFGPLHIATNYGAIGFAAAMGSFFFATYLVNYFYEDSCTGCFSGTFAVSGWMCLFSVVIGYFSFVHSSKRNAQK